MWLTVLLDFKRSDSEKGNVLFLQLDNCWCSGGLQKLWVNILGLHCMHPRINSNLAVMLGVFLFLCLICFYLFQRRIFIYQGHTVSIVRTSINVRLFFLIGAQLIQVLIYQSNQNEEFHFGREMNSLMMINTSLWLVATVISFSTLFIIAVFLQKKKNNRKGKEKRKKIVIFWVYYLS